MKKNKGFTLIELLAIIVILAIIAVITIPIILSVIENSRKGASMDSAYGYKEAVEKYYVAQLYDNNDIKLDGNYDILDGVLKGNSLPTEGVLIPIDGTIPTSGYLNYEDSKLKDGCIVVGDYASTFIESKITKVEKGSSCSVGGDNPASPTPTPSGPVAADELKEKEELVEITHDNGDIDYRYMGSNPNNYILYNCSETDPELQNSTNCQMWRIMSVEGDNLKIIKNDYIENDTKVWNEYGIGYNDWSIASLKTYLNTTYYNNLLGDSKSLIQESTWYLGGFDISWYDEHDNIKYIDAEGAYMGERGVITAKDVWNTRYPDDKIDDEYFPVSMTANISLMYASDYAFASSGCYNTTIPILYYGDDHLSSMPNNTPYCYLSDWLFIQPEPFVLEWTMSHELDLPYHAYWLGDSIDSGDQGIVWDEDHDLHYRPTLYLIKNIDLIYDIGDSASAPGSITNPYRIKKL